MITMYAYKVRQGKGRFSTVRLGDEQHARNAVDRINQQDGWQAIYLGKVKVNLNQPERLNADPKKRKRG